MRTIAIYLTVSWCFVSFAYSQGAVQHQNRAASLLLSGKPESAIIELRIAADLYESERKWVYYFNCLNELTEAYLTTKQHLKAKQTAKRALWKCIDILGRNKEEAAKAAHQLAEVYMASKRYTDALTYHQMGLDIREAMNGRFHPAVAASLKQMATACYAAGDAEEAINHLEEALAIIEGRYHHQHPELAPLLTQVGGLYQSEEQRTKARQYYERAIRILRAEEHPDEHLLSKALCQLAEISSRQQRLLLYQEALPHLLTCDTVSSQSAALAFYHLGCASLEEGKVRAGIRMIQRAIASAEAIAGAQTVVKNGKLRLAEWQRVSGNLSEAAAIYNNLRELHGGLPAVFQLFAGEVALADQKPEAARYWASRCREGAAPDSRLETEAKLLLGRAAQELGEYEVVGALAAQLDSCPNPSIATRGYLLQGEALRVEGHTDRALAAFQEGLEKCPGHRVLLLFQLHQQAALAYADLAAQSPQPSVLLQKAAQHFKFGDAYLDEAIYRPLSVMERHWLLKYHREMTEAALNVSYLIQRQSAAERDLNQAFRYLDSARKLEQWLAMGPSEFAPIYQQALFRRSIARVDALQNGSMGEAYLANDPSSDLWQKALYSSNPNSRYPELPEDGIQIADFQQLLRKCRTQSLHFFLGDQYLFVLDLNPERAEIWRRIIAPDLRRQIRLMSECTGGEALLEMGKQMGAQLLPPMDSKNKAPHLLVIPDGPLDFFPFAALSNSEGKTLGGTFDIYQHASASSFWQDCYSAKQLPGRRAERVALEKLNDRWVASAPALTTSDAEWRGGPDWLRNWIVEGGGKAWPELVCSGELECDLALLSLPSMQMDTILRYWPKEGLLCRRVLMPSPYMPEGDFTGQFSSLRSLQNRGAGNILLYRQGCTVPEALAGITKGLEDNGSFAQVLRTLRAEASRANAGPTTGLWHLQVFGSPNRSSIALDSIPVPWILATVALLILIGWWVKKG